MDAAEYKPFSFTHVLYRSGDRLGQLLALVSLAPVFVMVGLATLALSRRDIHVCTLAVGQLLNEGLNYVLKHTLREPRPPHPFQGHHLHVPAWGLPSDHSQFAFFFASYVTLFVRGSREGGVWAAAAWLGGAVVAASRVYLGYHTPWQVAVGAAVGAVTGAAWYAVTFGLLRPHFATLVGLPLARSLRIRDCSGADDIVDVEYRATIADGAASSQGRRPAAAPVLAAEQRRQHSE